MDPPNKQTEPASERAPVGLLARCTDDARCRQQQLLVQLARVDAFQRNRPVVRPDAAAIGRGKDGAWERRQRHVRA